MRRTVLIVSLFGLVGAPALAQYKYVGPDGTVTYSDKPPPAQVKNVEVKNFSGGPDTSNMPFELRRAVQNFPVVLYASAKCVPCDQGRTYLNQRGIPFSEKSIKTNDDLEALKKISPDSSLPVLVVGDQKIMSYSQSGWASALDDAGYPATSKLPRDYKNPPPVAAAPQAASDSGSPNTGANSAATGPAAPPPPPANAPSGFRF